MSSNSRYLLRFVLPCVLSMLGLQMLVEYGLLRPLAVQLEQLEANIQKRRALSPNLRTKTPQIQVQMDAILQRLPVVSKTNLRLSRMHHLADSNGVLLKRVNYQDVALPGPIVRKDMSADMSGTYPALRNYLRAVLDGDEALAIEAVEFNKALGAAESEVRVQLRLVLYSRGSQ